LHSQTVSAEAEAAATPDTMSAAALRAATIQVRHPTVRVERDLNPLILTATVRRAALVIPVPSLV
jgi:hypothetical protein